MNGLTYLHTEARIRSTPSASSCPWPHGGRALLYHAAFRGAEKSWGHILCTDSLPKKNNREKEWATLTQFFQNCPLVHTSPKEERIRGKDIHSLQLPPLGIKNIGEKFLVPQNHSPWGMWQTRYLTTSLQWIQYKKQKNKKKFKKYIQHFLFCYFYFFNINLFILIGG